VVDCGGLENR